MSKMEKFFETESGELIKNAEFDGYQIADRLLEGLMFQIKIKDDNSLEISVKEEDEDFFNQFNKEYFFNEALKHANNADDFYVSGTDEMCWLIEKDMEEIESEEEPDLGEYKTSKKYLNFISGVRSQKIRFNRKTAFISGKYFSGILDNYKFKITIKDESTIDFEVVEGGDLPEGITIDRLIEIMDSKDTTGYTERFILN